MAITFYSTAAGTTPDYGKYVFGKMQKSDRKNDADLLDFSLVPVDGAFVKLRRGNYIKIVSSKYGVWFTGYLTNDPEYEWLGHNGANKVWGYKYEASSDDFVLSLQPIGTVTPFVNSTQGSILKALIHKLAPGRFDVTNIDNGLNVARYTPDPKAKFADIVREFAEAANYRWKALDGTLYFQQQDSVAAGFIIDGNDKHFSPQNLTLTPAKDPILNDVLILGDIEPQGYMNEYGVGDGSTAQYPLIASPYGCSSNIILDDTFESLDTNKWVEFDVPQDFIKCFNGFLNVIGGNANGTLDVNVQSAMMLPLEGNLRITHGEYDFVNNGADNTLQGIVGGLWTNAPERTSDTVFPGCIYGIRAFRDSGGALGLRPVINGAVDMTQTVPVNYARRYIVRTLFGTFNSRRFTQSYAYRAADGSIAQMTANPLLDQFNVQTWIVEVDPSNAQVTNSWTWRNNRQNIGAGTTYALYSPVASHDLHCTVTGLTISFPIEASLRIKPKGSSVWTEQLVGPNEIDSFDGMTPVATIVESGSTGRTTKNTGQAGPVNLNPTQATLTFFKDSLNQVSQVPQPGDIIHLRYRRAGAAMARVVDAVSLGVERTSWGDNGTRSLAKSDLQPLPRTSVECELAAAAMVKDNNYQKYEGSYTLWSDYCTSEPQAGAILHFQNLDPKLPPISQEEVTEVITTIETSKVERFRHTVRFGTQDQLRRLLTTFAKQSGVASPVGAAEIPDWIDVRGVGVNFVADVTSPELVSWDADNLHFNTNMAPLPQGGFEVRYTDENWGADDGKNLVTRTTSQTFDVPRNSRGKICFVKAYDARNKLKWSEDLSNVEWVKDGVTEAAASDADPDGNTAVISTITPVSGNKSVYQNTGLNSAFANFALSVSVKGVAGQTFQLAVTNNVNQILTSTSLVFNGYWQRFTFSGTMNSTAGTLTPIVLNATAAFQLTRCSLELGTNVETVYCKTNATPYGVTSRFAAGIRVAFPFVPAPPTATAKYDETTGYPSLDLVLPELMQDVWGVEIRAGSGTVVPSAAGPWKYVDGINSAYNYGDTTYNPPPSVTFIVPVTLQEGDVVEINYINGLVSTGGSYPYFGPMGDSNYSGGSAFGNKYPAYYMEGGSELGECGLCGAFTDDNGLVILPFVIGYGRTTQVPPGATRLQIGINEDIINNDQGSFNVTVSVNGVIVTDPADASTAAVLHSIDLVNPVFDTHWVHKALPRPNGYYYLYSYNLLGEYSIPYSVDATKVMPTVNSLFVNDDTKVLDWEGEGYRYRIEISAVATYTPLTFNNVTKDTFLQLLDPDFFPLRYMKVTAYDALGDGGFQEIVHDYPVDPPIVVPDPPSTTITGSVHMNGWAGGAHVGDYENGGGATAHSHPLSYGDGGGTTLAYINASAALDSSETTAAYKEVQHSHAYAGCVWKFSCGVTSIDGLTLRVLSEVKAPIVTGRSAGVWYSTNNGSTWTKLYETPNDQKRSKRWDSVVLPNGTNPNQVRVLAFLDSHDNMGHYVYSIKLDTPASGGGSQ